MRVRTKVLVLKRLTYKQVSCMEHATGNFRWTRTIVMGKVVRVPRIPSKWNFSSFRSASSVFHRFCSSPFLLWILASPCNFNPYNFIPLPLSVIFIVARRTVHFSIVVSWKKTFHPFSHPFLCFLSVPTLKLLLSLFLSLSSSENSIKRSRTYASYRKLP